MSIERARLLIRVANQIQDNVDRRSLLSWADEILASSGDEEISNEPNRLSFPIPIFRVYKREVYDARLLKGWRIEIDGKEYPNPSAAARYISDNSENGWLVWRYVDKSTGKRLRIDKLRHTYKDV
jgi:hypothetical protein